jgi:hypothetical protein
MDSTVGQTDNKHHAKYYKKEYVVANWQGKPKDRWKDAEPQLPEIC